MVEIDKTKAFVCLFTLEDGVGAVSPYRLFLVFDEKFKIIKNNKNILYYRLFHIEKNKTIGTDLGRTVISILKNNDQIDHITLFGFDEFNFSKKSKSNDNIINVLHQFSSQVNHYLNFSLEEEEKKLIKSFLFFSKEKNNIFEKKNLIEFISDNCSKNENCFTNLNFRNQISSFLNSFSFESFSKSPSFFSFITNNQFTSLINTQNLTSYQRNGYSRSCHFRLFYFFLRYSDTDITKLCYLTKADIENLIKREELCLDVNETEKRFYFKKNKIKLLEENLLLKSDVNFIFNILGLHYLGCYNVKKPFTIATDWAFRINTDLKKLFPEFQLTTKSFKNSFYKEMLNEMPINEVHKLVVANYNTLKNIKENLYSIE